MAVPGRGITRPAAALGTQENRLEGRSLDNGGLWEREKNGHRVGHVIIRYRYLWLCRGRRVASSPRPEPGISEKAENLGSLCSLGLPSRAQASDDEHDAGMANKSPEFNWSRNTRHPMFRATSAP
jgi:hypothetical protein